MFVTKYNPNIRINFFNKINVTAKDSFEEAQFFAEILACFVIYHKDYLRLIPSSAIVSFGLLASDKVDNCGSNK